MRRKKTYKLPHRRHRKGKTDYRHRLELLKSMKFRLVVRKSLNDIICQIVRHASKGDEIIVSADSKELPKLGWKGHKGNIPAAYLTGLLCGIKAKNKKIQECVFDLGLYSSTKGSRLYAALKGILDTGIKIPHSDEILPSNDRITAKHIVSFALTLKKENPEKYKKMFSKYLKNKLEPEKITEHFEEVKKKILSSIK